MAGPGQHLGQRLLRIAHDKGPDGKLGRELLGELFQGRHGGFPVVQAKDLNIVGENPLDDALEILRSDPAQDIEGFPIVLPQQIVQRQGNVPDPLFKRAIRPLGVKHADHETRPVKSSVGGVHGLGKGANSLLSQQIFDIHIPIPLGRSTTSFPRAAWYQYIQMSAGVAAEPLAQDAHISPREASERAPAIRLVKCCGVIAQGFQRR